MTDSPFSRVPAEVRLMIYEHLFIDNGHQHLAIRSAGPQYHKSAKKPDSQKQKSRTTYHVLERSFHRRCYETTYQLSSEGVSFCASLMQVNRQIYSETAFLLYGKHGFDFGSDIEAVEPFLSDLTPASRKLIREISLYKWGPVPQHDSDKSEWRSVCRFLQRNGAVKKLRLVVQGGKPSRPWDGPKEFSATDFKFLAEIKHESLDWVTELAEIKGIEELEVLPDVHYCSPPVSPSMIIFAAFSASIERGLAEFLRMQLRLAV
ncbi:uncharacterized protein BCR38DRAFT_444509 [Pseudomassariella vexata]|uniref:DUF7730 domain-containing protein n=1 Tax=Pseudomassariella vexata TaxID=1141098 RepID=A0A1Y2DMB5_9PEZI|nr:uncharacterized protein BCR38DRAFT_444509 [Pseudomassariella vexata]ORY60276.1 hypothetical protein BCR38DRAFT_444509 [Pseudomassariella vexata]